MDKSKFSTNELTDGMMSGQLSRRRFQQILGAAGVSLVMTPVMSRLASAAAADQATYFTWRGYDVPEMFGAYIATHGETPNFPTFGGSEEGLTKMRAGYVVDVSHPCNQAIPRWVATGLFQTTDTGKLSNWSDLIPELYNLEGNMADGKPYMVPFDWGQTSVTYRTDLFDLQGQEESWGMLWDERYKGRLGSLASAADAWWCGAIYAGVVFAEFSTDESFDKVAALMRQQRPLIRMYTAGPTYLETAMACGELGATTT